MKAFDQKSIRKFAMENAIYIVLVLLVLGIAFQNPAFLSLNNLRNVLIQSSTRIIIALGVGGILITMGTDLSAGRQVGLAAVVSASMMQTLEYSRRFYPDLPLIPLFVPILLCIFIGIILGFFNGVIVSKLNVPPFIATLGTMVIIYGMNSIYFATEPNNSQPIGGLRPDFTLMGTGAITALDGKISIPYIVLIALAVAVLVWVLFNKTTMGKSIYAIGGNPQAARVSGINVTRTLIFVYSFAGALYALAGVLEAARTGGATNNYGNMYELDAIAAAVVGGVSVSGGIGNVPGIVAGVLIFTVINYGLTFIGVNPYWQQIVKGLIIVFAVAFDLAKYYVKK
ncbi:MAG: galactose/methyl galactoside ABC transporter permease MglC [Anaerolineae bacterium]|nr:galactose/methyl galactoside ABC transporter permease MglC [Anaerolineae bacterium]